MLYIDRHTPSRLFLLPIVSSQFFFFFYSLSTNFSRSNAPERGILKRLSKRKPEEVFPLVPPTLPPPSISLFHGKGTFKYKYGGGARQRSGRAARVLPLREISDCAAVRSFVAAERNKEAEPEERIRAFFTTISCRITPRIVRLRCAFFNDFAIRKNSKTKDLIQIELIYYRTNVVLQVVVDAWKFWRRGLF